MNIVTPFVVSEEVTPAYRPRHKIRLITATSNFDGHDAAINLMRRLLQATGVEVIHLGHNRSVDEIVTAAIQEDVNGIAVTSYQGGHIEFFKYMIDLLREQGCRSRRRTFRPGTGRRGTANRSGAPVRAACPTRRAHIRSTGDCE